jgi:hypothetical protein
MPVSHCEPRQINLAAVIYQCVQGLPDVAGCLEYKLIDSDNVSRDEFSQAQYLDIPMVIIEYVDSALEGALEFHKDRLLMAMSTGSSFYHFLKLPEPIFGYLIDTDRVEILVGYRCDTGVSIPTTMLCCQL